MTAEVAVGSERTVEGRGDVFRPVRLVQVRGLGMAVDRLCRSPRPARRRPHYCEARS